MTRRIDPDRLYQARRAATFNRLTGTKVIDQLDAEHWMARWEREAEDQGRDRLEEGFWRDGEGWIVEQRH